MRKIASLFKRNYDGDRLVYNEVTPGAEWVINGEGIATRKWDGSCCAIINGNFYRRYDAKHGKTPPAAFIPAQEPDPVTGHYPGWVPVTEKAADKWHIAAYRNAFVRSNYNQLPDGTYEAIGPHFQGNPEGTCVDTLIKHGTGAIADCPRDFDGLKRFLAVQDIEGIVWHHPDGRMVKIKGSDFGIKRQGKKQ